MSIFIKHIFTAIIYSVLLTLLILITTFITFPLMDWTMLYEQEIADVPFGLFVFILPVLAGLIIGIVTSMYWKRRLHKIEVQLYDLLKDQKMTNDEMSYKELTLITKRSEEIQHKFRMLAEQAQNLATKRAHEREKSLQEVVVQERNRLARELHDSVSQQLFAASMMMSAINEVEGAEEVVIKKQLKMVEHMIHQSQLEMRALLLHLRPIALKGKSLQVGIEELLQELTEKVPMEISWKLEKFAVDKGVEDQLFRILQESVSNTLRHAKATTFHVMLIERDGLIILRIVDDGIGFDIENVKTGSYGLGNMRERAYEVGGTFKLISLPNKGTKLEVKVPTLKKVGVHND